MWVLCQEVWVRLSDHWLREKVSRDLHFFFWLKTLPGPFMNRLKGFVTVLYLANIFRKILCLRTVPSQLHLTVESRGLSTDTHKSDLAHCISVPREKTYKADSQQILVQDPWAQTWKMACRLFKGLLYRYRRTKGPMVGAGSSWGSVLGPVAPSDDIDWYSSPYKGGQTIDKTPATRPCCCWG